MTGLFIRRAASGEDTVGVEDPDRCGYCGGTGDLPTAHPAGSAAARRTCPVCEGDGAGFTGFVAREQRRRAGWSR